ncbi:MAG: nucleotidyl transferase AbiEii/AbiGii toxin family protein [Candidatus Zixiibacteriota bacterium]
MDRSSEILLHQAEAFSNAILKQRLNQYGLNNIAKLELFLWDLEMFMQIQRIIGNKVVLKGGAAVQFYLPIDCQRSSVDIDMICFVSKDEIEETIHQIEDRFKADDEVFRFRLHKPEKPQTSLPLLTYYVNVPSNCKLVELATGAEHPPKPIQEIKIEFLLSKSPPPIYECSCPQIFAVKTNQTYQILPLDNLLADKLTTLGPNTIGIPNNRADEQIKQLYDIDALITWNINNINLKKVRDAYLIRAELETQVRGIEFDIAEIFKDVENQLEELALIDFPINTEYQKRINDFQSLYLKRSLNRNIAGWAIVGKKLIILLQLLKEDENKIKVMENLYRLEKKLDFNIVTGPAKGQVIKRFKESFLKEFESYSRVPINQIKGKHQKRIFWELLSIYNMVDIDNWVHEFFRNQNLAGHIER